MSVKNLKLAVFFALVCCSFAAQAQTKTLIREKNNNYEYEKKWKIEWGFIGSAGVSNVLKSEMPRIQNFPQEFNSYSVMYAPRPEAEVGFFGEIGKVDSKFSFQARLSYTMRAIPQPTFYASTTAPESSYQSIYLNGVTVGGTFFFKPVSKFRIGIGVEASNFLMTKTIKESNYKEYTESLSSFLGLRAVLGYQVSPRMDINVYGTVSKNPKNFSFDENAQLDNVSAGIMLLYRICGKEIHVKKEHKENKKVYKIQY